MGGGDDGPAAASRSAEVLAAVPVSADVGVAVGSALAAGGVAAPFIMTVDKAVTLAAAGQMSLGSAIVSTLKDMVMRPTVLVRSPALWMVAGVYSATYAAANLIDVAAERCTASPAQHKTGKLLGTTAVNMSASIAKDVAFAKMFGKPEDPTAVKRRVPLTTYGMFFTRDIFTIAAGFIVPPMVAGGMVAVTDMDRKHADKVAQLVSPMGMQLICTPLHLTALNLYNEPDATFKERVRGVWKTCPESTFVRMGRFLFAYGVSGIFNKELITKGRNWTTSHYSVASE